MQFYLFLLSFRVLIDELAKGRAVLSSQYQESQDAIQRLLNERHELQSHLTESYRCVLPSVGNRSTQNKILFSESLYYLWLFAFYVAVLTFSHHTFN